ncbi:MAG: UPF0280 family protein [Candidatus Xenobiia bacterium LiM19]
MYRERTYRRHVFSSGFEACEVKEGESDLFIRTGLPLREEALKALREARVHIESYGTEHRHFLSSLSPLPFDTTASPLVQDMLSASRKAGVGPMAAVAGAVAQHVGFHLLQFTREVIVENGGDIFIASPSAQTIQILTDNAHFGTRLRLRLSPDIMPCGICTSSGRIGPSLSFGNADAVTVISPSASLADAAATALGNMVKKEADITPALEHAQHIEGVTGVVVVIGGKMGAWGPAVEFV